MALRCMAVVRCLIDREWLRKNLFLSRRKDVNAQTILPAGLRPNRRCEARHVPIQIEWCVTEFDGMAKSDLQGVWKDIPSSLLKLAVDPELGCNGEGHYIGSLF